MRNEKIEEIRDYIGTTRKAARLCEKIGLILRQSEGESMQKVCKEELTDEEYQLILSAVDSESEMKSALLELDKAIRNTQTMRIIVAVKPSWICEQSLLQKLHNALREPFFIEFEERPEIIAGAIIEFKGKRTDLSLRARLDNKE